MLIRKVTVIITLLLGAILVLIYCFAKNPYVGFVGYALQLLGWLMFLVAALAKIRRNKDRQEKQSDGSTISSETSKKEIQEN